MISTHRERQIDAACSALTARGGKYFDLPTLLPASLVLELAGESLRPRLFFVSAPDGSELCLRPDLTIAAVVDYIQYAEYDNEPSAIACKGQVFRGSREDEDRPPEFMQIGHERFGDAKIVETDVTIFLAAWNACKDAGLRALKVRFCDGGLLPAIIAGADMPDVWRIALLEQTAHSRSFLNILTQASGHGPIRTLTVLEQDLADIPFGDALTRVERAVGAGDLSLAATRTVEDVTRRLQTRAQRALAPKLPRQIAQTLHELATFQQTTTMQDSFDQIVTLAGHIGVDLEGWGNDWDARRSGIQAQAKGALKQGRFDALGEEAFDYYDGMAFDIAIGDDFTKPVATGGRYDRLVGEISGGKRHSRAIGCVIRPDRFGADVNGET